MWDTAVEALKWSAAAAIWLLVVVRVYQAVGGPVPRVLRRSARAADELPEHRVNETRSRFREALRQGRVETSFPAGTARMPFASVQEIAREYGYRFRTDVMPANGGGKRWVFRLELPSLREVREAPEIADLRERERERWPEDPFTRRWQDRHTLAANRAQRAINRWNGLMLIPGLFLALFSPGFMLSGVSTAAFVVLLAVGCSMVGSAVVAIVRLARRKKAHETKGRTLYHELGSALVWRRLHPDRTGEPAAGNVRT
ncbi:hypothetical protein FHX37_4324 [Haloactinospora alba]|uniref:Uncharacterized protein n=1 Tax=Haloactinospora alba TaxID=405555 RepID=A0A543N6Z8_9ACTN|nr:hypothetical protein [Haloactinospora alba]TQN27602.1 hypothetical protein FHX37_4324 [Haloactinospora alba]